VEEDGFGYSLLTSFKEDRRGGKLTTIPTTKTGPVEKQRWSGHSLEGSKRKVLRSILFLKYFPQHFSSL